MANTYNAITNEVGNPFIDPRRRDVEDGSTDDTENEDTHNDSGYMIHVVPETNKTRWNHIEDLDSFFTRMYYYHQKHGFNVMILQELFELGQFVFVVFFATLMYHCIDYDNLFNNNPTQLEYRKIRLADIFLPASKCYDSMSAATWCLIVLACLFWIFRLIRFVCNVVQYWDIKMFFNTALKIEDSELDNLTWHEVQKKIREVQSEQQMCIHKEQLTELDIYHRILRFKNYMVAMMNKNLIPSKAMIPIVGEVVCLSRGLRYNIELILFRGPFSPFENNWHLKEEFKRSGRRGDLAHKLSMQITWLALANLLLCPLIFLGQLMYFFFTYAELIKREPGTLGARTWSQYGRLYLRHFNELDHELDARLNRAYRPAVKYMTSFSSPLMAVIARNIVFICGGVLMVFIVLTIYDEDVVQVEHVLTIISVLTAVVVIARVFIPDENMIWCPEQLMTAVLAHVHYLPVSWRGLAHTSRVRDQFGQFFQLRAVVLLNDLFSPIVTPFLLMFLFRPRALDIVDFFRNFTVSVVGVGDVCSFAQLDVRKHGNPDWQLTHSNEDEKAEMQPTCDTNQYTQGEHGKTELSLVHFTMTNPQWKMPTEARQFVQGLRRNAIQDLNRARGLGTLGGPTNMTAMGQSLYTVGSMGGEYSSIVQSILQTHNLAGSQMGLSMFNPPSHFTPNIVSPPPAFNQTMQSQMNSRQSFDFDRMLQQNLNDGSTNPLRNTLDDINEDEDLSGDVGSSSGGNRGVVIGEEMRESRRVGTSRMFESMGRSLRGGMSRREGPAEGSQDGLLFSLTGVQQQTTGEAAPLELTAAEMCLSTLYLHEIHHRQIRRRGVQQSHDRMLWQIPHQQPETVSFSQSSTAATTRPPFTTPTTSTGALEKTPLLGAKKS